MADHVDNERQGMRHLTASMHCTLKCEGIPPAFAQRLAHQITGTGIAASLLAC
jgi:hypothetical protein